MGKTKRIFASSNAAGFEAAGKFYTSSYRCRMTGRQVLESAALLRRYFEGVGAPEFAAGFEDGAVIAAQMRMGDEARA